MKIAVSSDNGQIFQHFGKTETFQIYTVENNEIVSTVEVKPEVSGHDAMAAFLDAQGVNAVICGNIGEGAQSALESAGIPVFSGAEGDTTKAVVDLINGTLQSAGTNCGCGCGGDGEGSCGCGGEGGCGGCGGGCGGCGGGAPQILYDGPNAGKDCKVHYEGTFNDGTVFDSSYERGEPIEFMCGVGMMIPGFDKAVVDMKVGDIVNIHLMPEEAYGPRSASMILQAPIDKLPGSENLNVGDKVLLSNALGQPIPVVVIEKTEESITLDGNHEMAGKELNFKIELVEIVE